MDEMLCPNLNFTVVENKMRSPLKKDCQIFNLT